MGKDFTQVRKDASQDASRVLKKVFAGKGKIQGNYYLVTNKAYNDAGLVVTLSAKDKDGGKATSAGKKLKAELAGVKFSRGTVVWIDSKMTFEHHQGSAKPGDIKKAFKNV